MKQVTQTLRTGVIDINDVPVPTLNDKFILVRNTVSVISAGTEKTKIDMGKKNLFQKAKARPDLVAQVLNKIKTEGLKKTFQTVQTRLQSPSPLGYSSAGEVVAVGGLVEGLQPGDRVACGGAGYANHAEYVAVPKNLTVKIPTNVTDEEASFATVGSIALQGVRLADPKIGETFLVLGLGLLGQITVQLLRANGCRVISIDLNQSLVEKSQSFGAIGIKAGIDPVVFCKDLTAGAGVDGVLVCAGTSSNQPIELCGAVTREKGRVVVVGAVRMDIPREDYFKKEISVVISRSYGPGRYDPNYEENGNDYPFGYVRFTEQRNMETFLQLVSSGSVDVKSLITHSFELDQAAEAYSLIEGDKTEPYLGIVLKYSADPLNSDDVKPRRIRVVSVVKNDQKIKLSFFGAGNYATASLIPPLNRDKRVVFSGLTTASGRTAQGVAKQFGFSFCSDDLEELLVEDTDVLFVATRHNSHAESVERALSSNIHVFVEKPLALNVDELRRVYTAYSESSAQLMVGFNRRFSPLTKSLLSHFEGISASKVINIRANVGEIPSDHWIQDPKMGGGRLIGEGCHFIDLATSIAGSLPIEVYASGLAKLDKSAVLNDNVIVSLKFANGSIACVTYVADGSKALAKEFVEVFAGGRSARLNDFKSLELYSGETNKKVEKLTAQNKGQVEMLDSWISSIQKGQEVIPHKELFASSLATILAVESIMIGAPLSVDLGVLDDN